MIYYIIFAIIAIAIVYFLRKNRKMTDPKPLMLFQDVFDPFLMSI